MSLYDFLRDRKRMLSERRVKNFLYQLVLGLNHLHRNGIFHRDIKPENILIKTNPSLQFEKSKVQIYFYFSSMYLTHFNILIYIFKGEVIKLADFGSVANKYKTAPHSAYISTRWYRAPECLLTSGYYGTKMDVWAIGCVFYEMLTLNPLFPGENELDQLLKIHDVIGSPSERLLLKFKNENCKYTFPKRNSIPIYSILPLLSDDGIDVLYKTLAYHPNSRISTRKLLDHNYFENCKINRKVSQSNSIQKFELRNNRDKSKLSNNSLTLSDSTSTTVPSCRSINTLKSSNNSSKIATIRNKNIDIVLKNMKNRELERTWGMNEGRKKDDAIKKLKKFMT